MKDEHEFFDTADIPWTPAQGAPGVSERVLTSGPPDEEPADATVDVPVGEPVDAAADATVDVPVGEPVNAAARGTRTGTQAGDELTRLARWAPGVDTSAAGVIRHAYYEEVYLLEGELEDLTLGLTFTRGHFASRPPGMPHGPYRTRTGCLMLEIRHRPH